MGNEISREQNKSDMSNIHKIVNHIASNYIFTSNFKDMKNLGDVKYCNNLVILTSRIIEENLNDLDIEYLSQRIKDGVAIDEMGKEKVIYLKKDDIPKLDVKNETQKRRLCVGIAKFYVKVAHIFASILKTINPTISYVDNEGNTGETSLMDKHKIPEDAETKMNTVSLCSKRLDTLVNNNNYDLKNSTEIVVSPDYCNMNSGDDSVNLLQEPGMVELEKLYNDKYDYDTGKYVGMSDKMKNKYNRDLEIFYKAFSDNSEPFDPKKIKKFSDIKLREHHKKKGCSDGESGEYKKKYKGEFKDKLFGDYAKHIKKMMDNTQNNQDKLLSVIDRLFVFVNVTDDSKPDKKVIMINHALTESKLQEVVEDARSIIMNLYITCEKDFLKGLEIFEAIVEKQISDTTMERINNLPLHRELVKAKREEKEREERAEREKEREQERRRQEEQDDQDEEELTPEPEEEPEMEELEPNEKESEPQEMEPDELEEEELEEKEPEEENPEQARREQANQDPAKREQPSQEEQETKADMPNPNERVENKPRERTLFDRFVGNDDSDKDNKPGEINKEGDKGTNQFMDMFNRK